MENLAHSWQYGRPVYTVCTVSKGYCRYMITQGLLAGVQDRARKHNERCDNNEYPLSTFRGYGKEKEPHTHSR
jgi:hypothetical protein